MLNRLFSKAFGVRLPLMNDSRHRVEILSWYHPIYVPAQHIALKITTGNETHYLSFSPASLAGLTQRSLLQYRKGVKGYFIKHYEDELLIQGFRNSWPAIRSELNDEQKTWIETHSFKKLSSTDILDFTLGFSPAKKAELKLAGKPSEVIELRTLDMKAMIAKINFLKTKPMKWASWSGSYFHEENTHNCASIALDVLYEGGLGNYITSQQDLLGMAGTVLGLGYAFSNAHGWFNTIKDIVIGLVCGRVLGGTLEGYTGIQSFLNLTSSQGEGGFAKMLSLRMLSTCFAAFVGVIKPGAIVPAFLTLPREVLNLVYQAKVEEESVFSFHAKLPGLMGGSI